MNKYRCLLPLLVTLTLALVATIARTQSPPHPITISVSGIEYDDPHFASLRDAVKKNTRVKSVKPSYTGGVAVLSFTYTGIASDLWDELPKSAKQSFKLSEMLDDALSLSYIASPVNNATSKTVATKVNGKDCGTCLYFPICAYDLTKSYAGKIYRGIRTDDDDIVYYYCEDGVVTKKWESTVSVLNQGSVSVGFQVGTVYTDGTEKRQNTRVVLKSNAPVNTEWTAPGDRDGEEITYRIISRTASVTADGVKYNDVIVVNEKRTGNNLDLGTLFSGGDNAMTRQLLSSKNVYYAKSTGVVKSEDVTGSDKATITATNREKAKKEEAASYANDALTKSAWLYSSLITSGASSGKRIRSLLIFRPDGIFINKINFDKNYAIAGELHVNDPSTTYYWRRVKESSSFYSSATTSYIELSIDKINWGRRYQLDHFGTVMDIKDNNIKYNSTGLPDDERPKEELRKEAEDANKRAQLSVQGYNKIKGTVKGSVDPSMAGSYIFLMSMGTPLIYQFNADGSYAYYVEKQAPKFIKDKGHWLISGDSITLIADRDGSDPVIQRSAIKKLNNAYTGKPSLQVAEREFESLDTKAPWPGLPPYGNQKEKQENLKERLNGIIDKELVGSWRWSSVRLNQETIVQLRADGTGETTDRYIGGNTIDHRVFEWRLDGTRLMRNFDCGYGHRCFLPTEGVEKQGNKSLKLGGAYVYVRM